MEKIRLDIQKFATKSTTFSESNISVINNTSSLTINIYFSADNQATWFASAPLTCTCNGQTQSKNVSHPIGGSVSASFTFNNIAHNTDGSKSVSWSWSCPTDTSVLGTIGESGTKALTKINRTTIDSFQGNDINGIFKAKYTTYGGDYTYKLRISIPGVKALETINNYISETEFQLSQSSLDYIYNYTSTTNQVQLGAVIEAWSGNTKAFETSELKNMCNITNANPIFNDFDFDDINPITLDLTGNSKICINGYSNVKVKIPIVKKAIAQKGATMVKYRVQIGESTHDLDYSNDAEVSHIIEKASIGTYIVYAIDSRGNFTTITKLSERNIEYLPLLLNKVEDKTNVSRTEDGSGTGCNLFYEGVIWAGNFGNKENTLSVTYEIQPADEKEPYVVGTTDISPTLLSTGAFRFNNLIDSNEDNHLWSKDEAYHIKLILRDKLTNDFIVKVLPTTTPNLSMAKKGKTAFGGFYDEEEGGTVQIDGKKVIMYEVIDEW